MAGPSNDIPVREPLSRERIVAEAIDLVEREGDAALSMRRLGSALGVQAMSLYHHVGSREELVDAMAERTFAHVIELDFSGGWQEVMRVFADALRQAAVAHPRTFRLVGVQQLDAPAAAARRMVVCLEGAGFDPMTALAVYRAVASYARGYALGEAAGFVLDSPALDVDEAFDQGLEALLSGFDAHRCNED